MIASLVSGQAMHSYEAQLISVIEDIQKVMDYQYHGLT